MERNKDNRSEGQFLSAAEIREIFDKIFKKCITLSTKSVVRMINGIFGTDYPDDSKLTYNWTEMVKDDDAMGKILADCIVTVNEVHEYHMEAQSYNDNEIVLRMFGYGYEYAKRGAVEDRNRYILKFPSPVIIYLYYETEVPDEYIIELKFNDGNEGYEYKVPVIKLPKMSPQEMDKRNMVILVPFILLKLREWVAIDKKNSSRKIMKKSPEELKTFIEDDIISTIEKNQALGNITYVDAAKLKDYTLLLRDYICDHLDVEGLEEVRGMTDHSLMTDIDILCEDYETRIENLQKNNDDLQKKLGDNIRKLAASYMEQDPSLTEDKAIEMARKILE